MGLCHRGTDRGQRGKLRRMENSVLRARRDTHRLWCRSGSTETDRRAGEHDSTGATTEHTVGQTADSRVPQITEEIEEVTPPRNGSRVEESRVQLVTRVRVQNSSWKTSAMVWCHLVARRKKERCERSGLSPLSPVMGACACGGRSRCVL